MITEERRAHLKRISKLGNQARIRKPPLQRFEENIAKDPTTGCWIWTAHKCRGYGQFKINGKPVYVHRWVYEQFNKTKLPKTWMHPKDRSGDVFVCHRCDVRACVNPDHLFLGSHDENMADGIHKKRFKHGESHPSCKLTEKKVREIRERAALGCPCRELASEYGVSSMTISRIVNRTAWSKVE